MEEKQSYWVTSCTHNVEPNYIYVENKCNCNETKTKNK